MSAYEELPEWFRELYMLSEDAENGQPGCRFRSVSEDRWIAIIPFLFTTAIILGYKRHPNGYEDRWCYESSADAERAFDEWDPEVSAEPEGWHRHPRSGRRRPNGVEEAQYHAP